LASSFVNADEGKLYLGTISITVVFPGDVIELELPEALGVQVNGGFPRVGVLEAVSFFVPPECGLIPA
jgi:hypothetical protein